MRSIPFLFLLLLSVASLPAQAFDRLFAPIAKRGSLVVQEFPLVTVDGKQRRLSPGAWIRNENNMIDLPVTLRGREFVVNYTENSAGDIDRVWILSAAEARKPAPADLKENQSR